MAHHNNAATTTGRRAIDIFIAGLLVLLPAAFLHSNFKKPGNLNALDRVVLRVSAPIQSAVSWVIEGVGGIWHHYVYLVDARSERDEVVKQNERLRRENAELSRALVDAQQRDDLAVLKRRTTAETIGARVVAMGTNSFFRVSRITLDRGASDVAVGMPVLADNGIVGRIQRVYGHYADVLLAVDPASSIPVLIPRTGGQGVLKGIGGENEYTCRIEYLLRSEEVNEGDLVVTSGLGGVFPRDVPIGRITKITKAQYGLYQEAEVKPDVDFSRLSTVLVILAPPPPPDPSASQKKSPEPAFGGGVYK